MNYEKLLKNLAEFQAFSADMQEHTKEMTILIFVGMLPSLIPPKKVGNFR